MPDITSYFGVNLAAVVATVAVIWFLAAQLGLIKRFFDKRETIRAVLEAFLILALAYALQELFILLLEADRISELHGLFRVAAEFFIYVGYAGFFARLTEGFLYRIKRTRKDWNPSNLSRSVFYCSFLLVAFGFMLARNDVDVSQFYVWGGATAAVFAFILQQTLGDLFSGLAMSIEKPFKIGDWIRLEDGTEGQVKDINWRATHLRGWDKTTRIIPNGTLARQSFTNLRGERHVFAPWYTVQVSGEHDPAQVTRLLQNAVDACSYPKKTPAPLVRLMFAESSPYTYMVWVHFENYPAMFAGREEIYGAIDAALRAEGMSIAADMQEITLTNATTPALPVQKVDKAG